MTEAERLCQTVPPALRPHAIELAENLLFMERKLSETREGLKNAAVVISYDNGGGQSGIRRNPAFDGYNALLRSFTSALSALTAIVGDVEGAPQASTLERFKVISMQKAVND